MALARRRGGILAVGVVAVAAGVVLLTGVARSEPHSGALESYPFLYTADLQGGDTATYGEIFIPNPDAESMRVLSVEPNVANLEIIDVVAVLPSEMEEHGIYAGGWGWPAIDEVPVTRPAVGTALDSADFATSPEWGRTELQLLIGLRTTDGAQLAGLNGVRVTYERDGKRMTTDFPGAMHVCAGALDGTCGERDADADMRTLGLLK